MAPSCGTSRPANAASARVRNSSIRGRLSYLLVVSIVAFLSCGAAAAAAGQALDAPAPRAKATLARKPVIGRASYYSSRMNGHKTATGERFSSHRMTAAAKGIPLGSNVVVTNLKNGRSVQVRINDCGHFRHGRKLDLSKGAASRIGLIHDGTAPVKTAVVSAPAGAKTCE